MEFVPSPDTNNVHLRNARPGFYAHYAPDGDGFTLQDPAARFARQRGNSGVGRLLFTHPASAETIEQPGDESPSPSA